MNEHPADESGFKLGDPILLLWRSQWTAGNFLCGEDEFSVFVYLGEDEFLVSRRKIKPRTILDDLAAV